MRSMHYIPTLNRPRSSSLHWRYEPVRILSPAARVIFADQDGKQDSPADVSKRNRIPIANLHKVAPFHRYMLVRVRTLPVQSQGGVGEELADNAVAGGEDGGGQDNAQRDQLRRDALQLAQTLGDGVGYTDQDRRSRCRLGWGRHEAEHTGLVLFLCMNSISTKFTRRV
ncbi:hypothetical protein KC363_g67 [Hortaea werneckii]|nr:hypothetical protein KC363_g67 [Hortaea werneckii]